MIICKYNDPVIECPSGRNPRSPRLQSSLLGSQWVKPGSIDALAACKPSIHPPLGSSGWGARIPRRKHGRAWFSQPQIAMWLRDSDTHTSEQTYLDSSHQHGLYFLFDIRPTELKWKLQSSAYIWNRFLISRKIKPELRQF